MRYAKTLTLAALALLAAVSTGTGRAEEAAPVPAPQATEAPAPAEVPQGGTSDSAAPAPEGVETAEDDVRAARLAREAKEIAKDREALKNVRERVAHVTAKEAGDEEVLVFIHRAESKVLRVYELSFHIRQLARDSELVAYKALREAREAYVKLPPNDPARNKMLFTVSPEAVEAAKTAARELGELVETASEVHQLMPELLALLDKREVQDVPPLSPEVQVVAGNIMFAMIGVSEEANKAYEYGQKALNNALAPK